MQFEIYRRLLYDTAAARFSEILTFIYRQDFAQTYVHGSSTGS